MILTKPALLEAIRAGYIIADPELVQENSVNFRLGAEMWTASKCNSIAPASNGCGQYIDPYRPLEFSPVDQVDTATGRGFILYPGQVYIGTTASPIGTTNLGGRAIVPEMRARSTTGRLGLTVALCAGLGDVGYQGRWALEVINNNGAPIFLMPGTEIGQIVFHEATPTDIEYRGEDRYQKTDGRIQFLPKPYKIP